MFNIDNLLDAAMNNATQDEVNTMLEKFKLNWSVNTEALTLPDGTDSGFKGIVREDTRKTFATCKDSYEVFQNSQLAELVMRIAEKTGYSLDNGGSFNGGGQVYIQLMTGQVTGIGQNNDTIKKYATALNSHNGTISVKWGAANTTISCKNTFNAASKELKNKARHTKNIQSVIDKALNEIEGVQAIEKSVFDTFFKMAETPVSKEDITKVIKEVTGVDTLLTAQKMKEEYSTYSINRMQELIAAIAREQKEKGQTLWGLFSGVTRYTTHTMPVPNRDNARQESKLIGSAYKTDNQIFSLLQA